MSQIGIGIIGAGRIGHVHGRNLARSVPGARLIAVADPFIARATWLDELGVSNRYTDHHELLRRDDIDAVFVCSSTDTHSAVATDSVLAGKHVFCEKPIDIDLHAAERVVSASRDAGVLFQVGFNRRFDPNVARARALVEEGRVGSVQLIRISSRDPEIAPVEYLKRSGGLLVDMTVHDIDTAEFVGGRQIVRVHAAASALQHPHIKEFGDVDTAVTTIWFDDDSLGVIDNSRRAVYGYDQRVEVFGSEGMVTVGNPPQTTVRVANGDGETTERPPWFFLERYRESFIVEAEAFVDSIRLGSPVAVDGEHGIHVMRVALAARESLRTGQPVQVDPEGES